MNSKLYSGIGVLVVLAFIAYFSVFAIPTYALELEVWSYTTQAIPKSVIDAYESLHPDVKVNQRQPSGDFRGEGYLVASAAGVQPALTHLNADFLPLYVASDLVQPLTQWINKGTFGDINVYFPGVLDGIKYKGNIYFVPHRMSVNTLLYNRQQFEESGLGGDKPPVTWDDFKVFAKKLTKYGDGNKVIRYGAALNVSTTTLTSWFQPTLWQAGGDVMQTKMLDNIPVSISEASRVGFNTEAGQQALRWYVEQVQEGYATQGSPTPFQNGLASMFWQNQSQVVKQYHDTGLDWVDVGPVLSSKQKVGYGSLAGWVVSKGPHVVEAIEFLAFTLRTENVRQFLAATAFLPVRKDINLTYFQPQDREWAQKFINEAPYIRFDILHPEIRALHQMITVNLRQAVLGQLTISAALEQAESQANVYLKEKGY